MGSIEREILKIAQNYQFCILLTFLQGFKGRNTL